jgi:phage baseplate assembly protein W
MTPQTGSDLMPDVTYGVQPSYTYKMNMDNDKVIGYAQGKTAMEQAIYKILNTERYKTPIYSWNYGVELSDLIGRPTSYCIPEIERRIKEALLQDDRISDVYDFQFTDTDKRGVLNVSFKVDTTEGIVEADKEVKI